MCSRMCHKEQSEKEDHHLFISLLEHHRVACVCLFFSTEQRRNKPSLRALRYFIIDNVIFLILDSQACISEFSSACFIEYLCSRLLDVGRGILCTTLLEREPMGQRAGPESRTCSWTVTWATFLPQIFLSSHVLSLRVLLLLCKTMVWDGVEVEKECQ